MFIFKFTVEASFIKIFKEILYPFKPPLYLIKIKKLDYNLNYFNDNYKDKFTKKLNKIKKKLNKIKKKLNNFKSKSKNYFYVTAEDDIKSLLRIFELNESVAPLEVLVDNKYNGSTTSFYF